jgi:alcohol dehydrogenase
VKRLVFPPFEFRFPTRLVAGEGAVDRLGSLARELGGRRALVVSDPGIVAAGHAGVGVESLRRAGLDVECFTGFGENPTTAQVDSGVTVAAAFRPDLLVGIGGGSSMDCCKGINFLHSLGGRMADYRGRDRARGEMLPSIAVPTTAGTGSETQSFALITDSETGAKMACGATAAAFRVAILDPRLTLTQPRRVTALTGVDAISHAIESHVSSAATQASRVFSRESWRLLCHALPCVLADGRDLASRAAGLAIENSMLGAAHALANPLTAAHGTVHGQAVGLMLPHVVRFNAPVSGPRYAELWSDLAGVEGDPDAAEKLARWLEGLLAEAGLETSLVGLGIHAPDLESLSNDAAAQWTGGFNPRRTSAEDLRRLYEASR